MSCKAIRNSISSPGVAETHLLESAHPIRAHTHFTTIFSLLLLATLARSAQQLHGTDSGLRYSRIQNTAPKSQVAASSTGAGDLRQSAFLRSL